MTSVTADSKPPDTPWEEAVSSRSTVSARSREQEQAVADQIMRFFSLSSADDPETRAWATAMRKPVEVALDDLRHDPQRAASLLAPVMEGAVKLSREHRHARRMETFGKWCVVVTRPRMWVWAIEALWEGESVWQYIQERAQWHEVPEIVLFDNRTRRMLGRARSHSHRPRSGEPSLDEMSTPACQEDAEEATVPHEENGDRVTLVSRVIVVVGWRCKLVARVRGLAPDNLRSQLQALCEEAERLLDYAPQPEMIRRLLESGLASEVGSSRPRSWVLMMGGVAAAALVMWAGVHEYRWHQLVAALDHEPGMKVLGEDTSWGRREIIGLRDPMARRPEDITRSLGLSPDHIILNFKSYLSAEDSFVKRREQAHLLSTAGLSAHLVPDSLKSSP